MTSMNLMPGIHNVSISSSEENTDDSIIKLEKKRQTIINLSFTLTGMNRLINPITSDVSTFYLYVLLTYQNGGKDFEVISSAQIYCDEDALKQNSISLSAKLSIPEDKVFPNEDFIWNYYSIDIIHFEREAEDGSDINRMLLSDKLFSTKLNIINGKDD